MGHSGFIDGTECPESSSSQANFARVVEDLLLSGEIDESDIAPGAIITIPNCMKHYIKMAYQLNKRAKTSTILIRFVIITGLIFVFGCENHVKDCQYSPFHIESNELNNLNHSEVFGPFNLRDVFHSDSLGLVMAFVQKGKLVFHSIELDSTLKTIPLDSVVPELINGISVLNIQNFAVNTYNYVLVFTEYGIDTLVKKDYGKRVYYNDDDFILFPNGKTFQTTLFFTNHVMDSVYEGSLIASISSEGQTALPIYRPRDLRAEEIGMPEVFLTGTDSVLIVSFNHSKIHYEYNVYTDKLVKKTLDYLNVSFEDLPTADFRNEKPSEELEKRLGNTRILLHTNFQVFGPLFRAKNGNGYFRVFLPQMPIDLNGQYLTNRDRPVKIFWLKSNSTNQYVLSSGQYFNQEDWLMFDNKLVHPNFRYEKNGKDYYSYDVIGFYDYRLH